MTTMQRFPQGTESTAQTSALHSLYPQNSNLLGREMPEMWKAGSGFHAQDLVDLAVDPTAEGELATVLYPDVQRRSGAPNEFRKLSLPTTKLSQPWVEVSSSDHEDVDNDRNAHRSSLQSARQAGRSSGLKASKSGERREALYKTVPSARDAASSRLARRLKLKQKRSTQNLPVGLTKRITKRPSSEREREADMEKKKDRLLRNREAAIRSRLAAKKHHQILETEVKELQERVEKLKNVNTSLKGRLDTLLSVLVDGNRPNLTEAERRSILEIFKNVDPDNSQTHRSNVNF
ncbi:hypothetical protein NDN08_006739 [Rhodosorus marinus]|uniref:BZIP domain-containing protein n=1 Tax=Rhodosorus marinus TaxID=101924 RepID=A0AAV8UMF9_9RHOD|nr:hypothetical protein NDN08_006739 [Rhodosorus marinus]